MIFIAGIVISLFLSALLLFKKNKSQADWILLAWFLFITLHQLLFFLTAPKYQARFPFLEGVYIPLPLLHGPFLFLYASSLTNNLPRRKIFNLIHFLPALICYLYLIKFFVMPAEQKLYIMAHNGVGFETFVKIKFIAIILSGVGYVIGTLILLWKHQKKIKDNFSDIEKINLRWLQYLTYGIGVIWLVVIFGTDELTFVAAVLFVLLIGIFGIGQTTIFTNRNAIVELPIKKEQPLPLTSSEQVKPVEEFQDEQKRYEKSGLSSDKKQTLEKELKKFMEEDKVFLDPELSLDMLASQLHIHPNYLSQFINEELSLTFYDYINSKRVDEFKRVIHLPENSNFNLLGIAYQCGFNSKSSFNRNFKKFSGQTPSEYLNDLKGSQLT